MARTIPSFPTELKNGGTVAPPITATETLHTYDIEVITPLFGGGVEAGVNDPIALIRPSSIRGHLRFWWRATRGATFSSAAKMRQREAEIWGSTEEPSKVVVRVTFDPNDHSCSNSSEPVSTTLSKGQSLPIGWFDRKEKFNQHTGKNEIKHKFYFDNDIAEYAAFPCRPIDHNELLTNITKGIVFRLCLEYPDSLRSDIEAALTAWVNFGGIGARTRRGFGALYCEKLAKVDKESFSLLNKKSSSPSDWPILFHDCYLTASKRQLATISWKSGILQFQQFRQCPVGRREGNGRSNWPEAEAIRNLVYEQWSLTNPPQNWHRLDPIFNIPPSTLEQYPVYFPRAEFGLPIIFEIRGETIPDGSGKNIKPTLQFSEKHDRLASPLMIRPIKFKDGSVSCMFLRLRTPTLSGAFLKKSTSIIRENGKNVEKDNDLKDSVSIEANQIRNPKLNSYTNSPLGPSSPGKTSRSKDGSALDAFFAYLRNG